MCCKEILKKLGGTDECVTHNSTVATGTSGRRFEVEVKKDINGSCSIVVDKLDIKDMQKCDNVVCICHKANKPLTSHYFIEFKDNKSSRKPFDQIDATIAHFKEKGITLHFEHVHAAVVTTTGIHSSLLAKKDRWVREFVKAYGTKPTIAQGKHTVKF